MEAYIYMHIVFFPIYPQCADLLLQVVTFRDKSSNWHAYDLFVLVTVPSGPLPLTSFQWPCIAAGLRNTWEMTPGDATKLSNPSSK